jgi:hypothetical protein
MPLRPNFASLRWEPAPYTRKKECFVDVPGVGRYLIKRVGRSSHNYRAHLNGAGTTFWGTVDEVKLMVQRAVDAMQLGELNRAAVSTRMSPLPKAADLTRQMRILLEGGAPPWVQKVEQRDDNTLCVLTEGRVFEVSVR